tara:strand:+ start:571 stop:759 length:189 start_codon:yes stop_codon:yes gene_type:complete
MFPQKGVNHGFNMRPLLIVGRSAMASFHVFIVKDLVALISHFGDHLSGMSGVNPIISSRSRD